jgi:hypothetical protein
MGETNAQPGGSSIRGFAASHEGGRAAPVAIASMLVSALEGSFGDMAARWARALGPAHGTASTELRWQRGSALGRITRDRFMSRSREARTLRASRHALRRAKTLIVLSSVVEWREQLDSLQDEPGSDT